MNSVATAYLSDFHWRFKGSVDGVTGLRQARIVMALMGLLATASALILAGMQTHSLWDAYNSLIGLAGSGLAGLFALGMFSRRANAGGALAGALISAVVLFFVQRYTTLHFFLHAGIGFLTCFICGWFLSLLLDSTKTPAEAKAGWQQPLASDEAL
jgi:solute:Na+ symporter, SSS family